MQRLNARDHAQRPKTWDIFRGDGFDVLDPRPRVLRMVRPGRFLVGIERGSNCPVTNGMREDLQPAPIQFRDRSLVFHRLPKHFSDLAGIIAVGREHRCRVRFYHTIQHGLNHATGNPLVVVSVSGLVNLFEILGPQFWRIEKVRHVEPQRQLAIAPKLVVQIEILGLAQKPLRGILMGSGRAVTFGETVGKDWRCDARKPPEQTVLRSDHMAKLPGDVIRLRGRADQ